MKSCFHCRKPVEALPRPGRGDTCSHCGSDLKVCLNCAFHEASSYNECRETSAERVKDKDKANFCEFFEFRDPEANRKADDPFKGLKDLFK
ncbi:MAG: hypothetical protein A2X93_03765 [Deltaproteobacteria bacterium GWC2_56_8]|nr:MAG: hypothetical protein A2X99_01915 [Deltaproteobacteria bacterium GWB2_55_19]OGP37381.1 MAG: hypothetical protein A2X93_03765 [Deltaproteobacteria bacterium GWC2_56_8]HAO92294.1 hypothetical protein [Deltaproteobacteria bacterium]